MAFVRKFFTRRFATPIAQSGSSIPGNVVLTFAAQPIVSFSNQYIITF